MTAHGSAPRPAASGGWGRLWRWLPLLLVLGLSLQLLLPQFAQLEHALTVIRQMRWWAVALAVAAQVLSYAGSGWHLRDLVGLTNDRLSVRRGMVITIAAYSIGLVAGGTMGSAAAIYRWMRCKRVSREGALLSGWIPPIATTAALTGVSIFGLVPLLFRNELTAMQLVGFLLALALLLSLVGLLLWGYHYRAGLTYLFERVERALARLLHRPFDPRNVERSLNRFYGAWDALRSGAWRRPARGIALMILGDMLTVYFVFLASGHAIPLGVLLAGYGLPLLLGRMAFFLPGGVGVVEASMAAMYGGLGAPQANAVVAVLAYRVISFWLPIVLGFPLAAILEGRRKGEE